MPDRTHRTLYAWVDDEGLNLRWAPLRTMEDFRLVVGAAGGGFIPYVRDPARVQHVVQRTVAAAERAGYEVDIVWGVPPLEVRDNPVRRRSASERALQYFGETSNPRYAGYILADGRMLDFSEGDRDERIADHRQIESFVPSCVRDRDNRYRAVRWFIQHEGAIRFGMTEEGTAYLEFYRVPTGRQREVLREVAEHHARLFLVDLTDSRVVNREYDACEVEFMIEFMERHGK